MGINQLAEPDKSIGKILIEFYETMKSLEDSKHKGGKQAVTIAMTISYIKTLIE